MNILTRSGRQFHRIFRPTTLGSHPRKPCIVMYRTGTSE